MSRSYPRRFYLRARKAALGSLLWAAAILLVGSATGQPAMILVAIAAAAPLARAATRQVEVMVRARVLEERAWRIAVSRTLRRIHFIEGATEAFARGARRSRPSDPPPAPIVRLAPAPLFAIQRRHVRAVKPS